MTPKTPLLVLALAIQPTVALAEVSGTDPPREDLASLSFEELASLKVTSVSKRPEALASAAAAVYVITGDDIRRSGATTLADALRLAPNLHVAQASGSAYEISARGLNGSNTSVPNKLLVLVDGRSVYSPLFSGVFWDTQDVPLEDIERIEVVSGPGGTLWGVNAVNGVINVVTRRAQDTIGTLLSAASGRQETTALLRHGRSLGDHGAVRAWLSHRRHGHTQTAAGTAIDDAGRRTQLGARADLEALGGSLTLLGAAYELSAGQPEPGAINISGVDLALGDIDASGAHALARWERLDADGAGVSLQMYFDRSRRVVPPTFSQRLDIVDLQVQQGLAPMGRHRLTWGANARATRDRVENSEYIAFLPASVEQRWTSVFAQDDIRLTSNARVTVGTRLEHNVYTGTEFLPNVRWSWQATPRHMLWSAWSRAVRAPSRLDADVYIPGRPPFLLDGGARVRSEVGQVAEVGYRGSWSRGSASATVFHADYDHLRTTELAPSMTYVVFDSLMRGRVRGMELWGHLQPSSDWRISAGLTVQDTVLQLKPGSNDLAGPLAAGNDPGHYWQLRSAWNIGADKELDLVVRHVAEVPHYAVDAYTAVDLRFGWHPRPGLEMSLAARNLGAAHGEFREPQYRTEFEPSAVAKITWSF